MKIFLESIEGGQDLPFANLDVQCHGERVGRIRLPVDGAQTDIAAVGELLRDFSDCLVEWTRRGTDLVPAAGNAYPESAAAKAGAVSSPPGATSAARRMR